MTPKELVLEAVAKSQPYKMDCASFIVEELLAAALAACAREAKLEVIALLDHRHGWRLEGLEALIIGCWCGARLDGLDEFNEHLKAVALERAVGEKGPMTATEVMMREYQGQTLERVARQITHRLIDSGLVTNEQSAEIFQLALSVFRGAGPEGNSRA